MAKTWRKTLLAVLLTLCTVLCIGAFAACNQGSSNPSEKPNPQEPQSKTYTVEVRTDEDVASGVKVTVKKGSATFETKTTDESGTVTFELAPDSYEIALKDLPDHYEIPADASLSLTAEMPQLTVTLARKFAYKVYLVNEDDTPYYAAGVTVGVCTLSGNCLEPVAIDNGGLATIEVAKGDYHVQILGLPAGYVYKCDADGYYTDKNFSETDTQMSITIYAAPALDLSSTPMTDTAKEAFVAGNGIFGLDLDATAHYYTKEIAAHTNAYLSITPTMTGEYNFYSNYATMNYFDGTTFQAGTSDTYLPQYYLLEAGKTYYFAFANTSDAAATAQFVVASPYSSYSVYRGVGGTFDVTVGKENTVAVIEYTSTAGGTYTLTAQGETLAIVSGTTQKPLSQKLDPAPEAESYTKGATAGVALTAKDVARKQTTMYFTVAAKADSYPATVSVKLEKTAEVTGTYTYAEVKEPLTQYTKAAGTELYGVPMDGTATLVYNTTDKFYHLGTADGKVVVVLLTKAIDMDRFSEGAALAYMELVNTRLATYEFAPDNTKPNDIVNYTKFLRGFEDYAPSKLGGIAIPEEDDIETEIYYAKYVNEDGAYPLTQELKAFLELFYAANEESFMFFVPEEAFDADCGWMFPLYYYDAETAPDPLVGEYKFVKLTFFGEVTEVGGTKQGWDDDLGESIDIPITDAEYKLVVNKNHTFTISHLGNEGYEEEESGSWSKSGDAYTFTNSYGDVYTVTITATTLTLSAEDVCEWIFKIPTNA